MRVRARVRPPERVRAPFGVHALGVAAQSTHLARGRVRVGVRVRVRVRVRIRVKVRVRLALSRTLTPALTVCASGSAACIELASASRASRTAAEYLPALRWTWED